MIKIAIIALWAAGVGATILGFSFIGVIPQATANALTMLLWAAPAGVAAGVCIEKLQLGET